MLDQLPGEVQPFQQDGRAGGGVIVGGESPLGKAGGKGPVVMKLDGAVLTGVAVHRPAGDLAFHAAAQQPGGQSGLLFQIPHHRQWGQGIPVPGENVWVHGDAAAGQKGHRIPAGLVLKVILLPFPLGHEEKQAQVGHGQNDQNDIFQFWPLHGQPSSWEDVPAAAQSADAVSPPASR